MTDPRVPDTVPVAPGPVTEERAAENAAPIPAGSGWRPPRSGKLGLVMIVLLAIGGMAAVLSAWRLPPFATATQATDNAYVRGRTTVISPQVSGYVRQVLVHDFDTVRAGQPLIVIDDRIYRERVEQAAAQVGTAQATLANARQSARSRAAQLQAQDAAVDNAAAQLLRAQADMRRVDDLVTDGSVSLRERDQTLAALRQAQAGVRQANAAREIARQDVRTVAVGRGGQQAGVSGAEAARRLAAIDVANTVVRAPENGRLSEIGVRLGQYVTAGSQLMFLVPPETWVIANYKEAQTARIAVGQPVSFTVDALGNAGLTGRVERLSPAAGSEFAVLKADNATGNFSKVPQRIAVRIRIDPGQPLAARLRPGMSVTARIDTAAASSAR